MRHTYTATGTPAVVVRPRTATEVLEALGSALAAGHEVAPRSGGHGISSASTDDGGNIMDLGALDGVQHLGGTRVRLDLARDGAASPLNCAQ